MCETLGSEHAVDCVAAGDEQRVADDVGVSVVRRLGKPRCKLDLVHQSSLARAALRSRWHSTVHSQRATGAAGPFSMSMPIPRVVKEVGPASVEERLTGMRPSIPLVKMRPSMLPGLALVLVVSVVQLTAGCSSDRGSLPGTTLPIGTTTSAATRAEAACRTIDVGRYYSSAAGTVGDARRWTLGAGSTPLAGVFPDQPESAFVAWCWFHNGNGYWAVVADGNGHKANVGVYSSDPPASGPPAVG